MKQSMFNYLVLFSMLLTSLYAAAVNIHYILYERMRELGMEEKRRLT